MSRLMSAALPRFKALVAAMGGAALIGFVQQGAGAVPRTLQDKARDSVSIADFRLAADPDDTLSIRRAIATGRKCVRISIDAIVSGPIDLAPNQVIDFDGGSLVIATGTVAPNGILYGNSKANIKLIGVDINAAGVALASPVSGINLVDCIAPKVQGVRLKRANISVQSADNSVKRKCKIVEPEIDLDGLPITAIYISGVNGVKIVDPSLTGGKEGIGVYNASRNVKVSGGEGYGFTGDGLVIISGQIIDVAGFYGHHNQQSGLTTQRMAAGSDCRRVVMRGCFASHNLFDGFDIRGHSVQDSNYGEQLDVIVTGCHSWENGRTGFYFINAPGAQCIGCKAGGNGLQGFRADNSPGVSFGGSRSISNANLEPDGPNKAGFMLYNCVGVVMDGCTSSNEAGATQSYGASFTGSTAAVRITGGDYQNNVIKPFFMGAIDVSVVGARCNENGFTKVLEIAPGLIYRETCNGIPGTGFAITRAKGSEMTRLDGGAGEKYISDGGGAWHAL